MVKDQEAGRAELLAEIGELRRRLGDLEERAAAGTGAKESEESAEPAMPRSQRLPLDARIEFIGDFDVALARGVDHSAGGLCFELDDDLPFEMRFSLDGQEQMRRARCVWLRRKPEGGYFIGLEFIEPEPGENF